MSASPDPEWRGSGRRLRWASALAVLVVALLPSLGTWSAPWIAEDSSLLAEAQRSGPWADWTRSQGGLHQVRFWRPVVSTSWALQEASTGIDPRALRAFNLACHAATALCVWLLVRRLGGKAAAAFVAGSVAALFPEQGGTVTWLAGRTDLLVGLALVASSLAALSRWPLLGLPFAFLAVAAKEFGVLALPWGVLLLVAQRHPWREVARRAWPLAAGVLLALGARRLALGTWTGGYPPPDVGLLAGLPRVVSGLIGASWSWALPVLALLALGAVMHALDARGVSAALACAAGAAALLYPLLLDDGFLEPQNRRLLHCANLGLALASGLALARATRPLGRRVLAGASGALLAWLFVLAWRDTHEWAGAARAGEERIAAARAVVAIAAPDARPVLFDGFPREWDGAYCLGFGLADRFRAPFPATPRPVWPLRPIFLRQESVRPPSMPLRADGSLWPFESAGPDDGARRLAVVDGDGRALERLTVDETSFVASEDRSLRLCVGNGPQGAMLEVLVYTEQGYEPFALGVLDAQGRACASLMQLFAVPGTSATVGGTLTHVADLGALDAYLEFRATDEQGGILVFSRWIELVWSAELLERSLSAR